MEQLGRCDECPDVGEDFVAAAVAVLVLPVPPPKLAFVL
jgi:hypothetical protein